MTEALAGAGAVPVDNANKLAFILYIEIGEHTTAFDY